MTADEITRAAEANWATKFRLAFDLMEARPKELYDALLKVRRELRNFVAHGSFGKQGEAHSTSIPLPAPYLCCCRTRWAAADFRSGKQALSMFLMHC
jgi:hypothetical protein